MDRIFVELDGHTDRLITLSEIVHKNAGILGIVTKLVVGIMLVFLATVSTVLYNHNSSKENPVQYQKNSPVENLMEYKIIDRKNDNSDKINEGDHGVN